jgi:ATP adenylyltransferase
MLNRSHAFNKLGQFIREQMRMSHIYQPVMLSELLQRGGRAKVTDIAKALLMRDQSQIEYYEQITKNMVGRVLTKNRNLTERVGDEYRLNGFGDLDAEEIDALIVLCRQKVDEYVERRGDRIWSHRTKSEGYISGTFRRSTP